MTELPDLESILEDLGAELPPNVRKTLKSAVDHGWQLNKPGMTIALRLNHPVVADAYPVYISWTLGRTPKGALSWKFGSCGTRTLIPLSGADLLVYLEDPTTVLPDFDPGACESHLCDDKDGKNPAFVWKCGRVYCESHAKTALLKADFDLGHFGPPSDYNPDDPPPWDEEKTPSEILCAGLGGKVLLDIGQSPAPAPARPLRVKVPALRVQAPSPPSS